MGVAGGFESYEQRLYVRAKENEAREDKRETRCKTSEVFGGMERVWKSEIKPISVRRDKRGKRGENGRCSSSNTPSEVVQGKFHIESERQKDECGGRKYILHWRWEQEVEPVQHPRHIPAQVEGSNRSFLQ